MHKWFFFLVNELVILMDFFLKAIFLKGGVLKVVVF